MIEWTGSKYGASTGTAIGVDAFDILGTLTQGTQTNPIDPANFGNILTDAATGSSYLITYAGKRAGHTYWG